MVKFSDAKSIELPAKYDKLTQFERARVREQYVRKQQGLCYYCKGPLAEDPTISRNINWILFPGGRPGFLKFPVHLHHSHDTGLTLGAVHAYCNAVLWQYHGE